MNIAKQTNLLRDDPGAMSDPLFPVVPLAQDHPARHHAPLHHHLRAQLLYASAGVMSVFTRTGTWVVPPQQAVWIPAGIEHEVRGFGPLAMRSLYVHPEPAADMPAQCCVVNVPPLLRELVLKAVALPSDELAAQRGQRLVSVILDQLGELEPAPLHLPLPLDSRLKVVADALLARPDDERTLSELALTTGASARTLARLFVRDTGMTFGNWRQQLRLVSAVERLGAGYPVTQVAYDLGYRSPSAFVAMFRRVLGKPPGQYIRQASIR